METLMTEVEPCHWQLHITTTQPVEFIDLSEPVQALVTGAGRQTGLINIQSLHTTAAIVLNEAEPLLLDDFADLLERAAPCGAPYRQRVFLVELDGPRVRDLSILLIGTGRP